MKIAAYLFLAIGTFGCTKSPSSSADSAASVTEINASEDPGAEDIEDSNTQLQPLPEITSGAGQLQITLADDVDPSTVEGYVVGRQDQFPVSRAEGNVYYINNLPPGKHDIIMTAGTVAVTTLTDFPKERGVRLSDVEILSGVATTKKDVKIPPAGKISGRVSLVGSPTNLGIKVFIPGTGYDATTDDQGNFQIDAVPVGTHNLAFMMSGYHTGRMEGVSVPSDKTVELSPVILALDTGASGFILINEGAETTDNRTVELIIGATSDAVLMQVSESETFQNASWRPLQPTMHHEFKKLGTEPKDGKGEKSLYVRFANANGLESAPFSDSISIDIFRDGGRISINEGAPSASLRRIDLGFTVPKNAVSMRVAVTPEFLESDWESASTAKTFLLPTPVPTGEAVNHTLYVQFRDKDGYLSKVFSDAITLRLFQEAGGALICNEAPVSTTRNLTFQITVPPNATEMMLSSSADFTTGSWEPVAAVKTMTVSDQGMSTFYIKFRDVDHIEFTHENWQDSVTVDLIPSTSATIAVVSPTLKSADGPPDYSAALTYPANAVEMKIASAADFSAATFVPVAPSSVVSFPPDLASCGSHTILLQFRDADGYVSQTTWSRSVTYDCWDQNQPPAAAAPIGRSQPSVAWTGNKFIVWGGTNGSNKNNGDIYDPTTNSWEGANLSTGAPTARNSAHAVWTGTRMLVWGGSSGGSTGGMLDPSGPTWTAMDTVNAPLGRAKHTVIWTGSEMIVWGGRSDNTGGRFDPNADANGSWTATSTTGAPSGRHGHVAGWSGTHMFIWGGTTDYSDHTRYLGDGAAYDPVNDNWTTIPTAGAPAPRAMAYGTIIGNKFIVWGGEKSSGTGITKAIDGAVFDFSNGIAAGTWTPMSTVGAPSGRCLRQWDSIGFAGVTSDNRMLIWGGVISECTSSAPTNTGAIYDPSADTWVATPTTGARPATQGPAVVLTGDDRLIIWGGWMNSIYQTTGSILTLP